MQIVTDRGADVLPEQLGGVEVHYAPLRITLDDKVYLSGVDLDAETFYRMLEETHSYPTTTQPSAGEFAELYRELAKKDPDILSIHISSGLSGTYNAARLGAELVPEANITLWNSGTLSCPFGWQVEETARMLKAGASLDEILTRLAILREQVHGMYTLESLKYLIHGGRISHIKGLMASMLSIKPIIYVEKKEGKYAQLGQHITMKRAIYAMADQVAKWFGEGASIRLQLLHGLNPTGLEMLRERMSSRFDITWLPSMPIAPVLGAHTGPSMVGMAVGPASLFTDR